MSFLSDDRYREIEETVYDMYESTGMTTFPIDVYQLCDALRIPLLKYSDIALNAQDEEDKQGPVDYQTLAESRSFDSFSCYTKECNPCYKIFYNQKVESPRHLFSIMHEIGHIQLGHFTEHRLNEIEDNPILEYEANFFAMTALAPVGAMLKFGDNSPEDIQERFGVSEPCAKSIYNKRLAVVKEHATLIRIYLNSDLSHYLFPKDNLEALAEELAEVVTKAKEAKAAEEAKAMQSESESEASSEDNLIAEKKEA